MKVDADDARTPQSTFVFVSAALLDSVEDVRERPDVFVQATVTADEVKFQRWIALAPIVQFELAVGALHRPLAGDVLAEQSLMRPEVQRRAQLQPQARRSFEQSIDEIRRVLQMRHDDAL